MRFSRLRRCCVAAAALLLTASGCGATPSRASSGERCVETSAPLPDPSSQPSAPELVLAASPDDKSQVRQQLVRRWNNDPAHTLKARMVELPDSTDLLHADNAAAAQNGYPRYDVTLLDVAWIPEFADACYLRPLDGLGFKQDDFFPAAWQASSFDGHLFAVPYTTDAGLLYYRTDLSLSPPGSWADLAAGKPARPAATKYTLATQLDNYEGLTVNALEAIWSVGGHFMTDGVILDQQAREGLTDMVKAVFSGRVAGHGPSPSMVGSTDFNENRSIDAFRSGQAALMRNWPSAVDLIPTKGAKGIPFAVKHLNWPSVLGGWSLAVTANSSHPQEAVELIKFLTNYDNQEWIFQRSGQLTARSKVYDDQRVQSRSYIPELKAALGNVRPRPAVPRYVDVSRALREAMTDLLTADHFDPAAVSQRLDKLEAQLRDAQLGR